MAVVWNKEIMKARSQSGSFQETYVYTRAWLIRVDAAATPLPDITNAAGIAYLDAHPDDASCKALEFDTTAADDSGLLYLYKVTYKVPPPNKQDPENPSEEPGSAGIMRMPVWSGSSSSKTVPVTQDINGDPIANSAGDPLEDITKEQSDARLSLKQYYLNHATVMSMQSTYTDTVNDDSWNGGAERTWRCLGCSFQLQNENVNGGSLFFWEVTWEFAYDRTTWDLKPWDIGFAQLVDDEGVPTMAGTKRAQIKGQDGKPVRQPVALQNGMAKAAGDPPDALAFEVYEKVDFMAPFGQVFTPGI